MATVLKTKKTTARSPSKPKGAAQSAPAITTASLAAKAIQAQLELAGALGGIKDLIAQLRADVAQPEAEALATLRRGAPDAPSVSQLSAEISDNLSTAHSVIDGIFERLGIQPLLVAREERENASGPPADGVAPAGSLLSRTVGSAVLAALLFRKLQRLNDAIGVLD